MKKAHSILLWLVIGLPACAQSYLYDTGNMPSTARIPINNGYIDVNNGEVHLEISIATQTVRGRLPLDETLEYDSRIWKIIQNPDFSFSWSPTNIANSYGGSRLSTGLRTGGVTNQASAAENTITWQNCYGQDYPFEEEFIDFTWTDPQGSTHKFATSLDQYLGTPCTPPADGNSTSGYALDGSGYFLTAAYNTSTQGLDIVVYDKQGNEVYPTLQDTNGNYYSEDGSGNLIDTLGQAPILESSSGNQIYYDVLTYGGTRARYTINKEVINFSTNFLQSGVHEFSGAFYAIQSIQLPDGSTYSFTYDSGTTPGYYGELTSITLPSGGVIQLGYQNFLDSYSNQNRWISSVQKDGSTTTLAPQTDTVCSTNSGCQEHTTVTPPDGNATKYIFTMDAEQYPNANSWNTEMDMYQGGTGGTRLKSVNTTYTYNTLQIYNNESESPETYLIPQTQTVQTSLYSSSQTQTAQAVTTLDSIGANPTDVQEWDYYSGTPPASPTLETAYTFGEHINGGSLPTEIKVSDGSGNKVQDTLISYDQQSPTQTSGLPNHNTPTGPYGDVTTVSEWINTPGGYFTTTSAYDDAGAVLSTTNPNGTTTFGHDTTDTFVTSATPPTPSSGVSLTWNWTYDPSTGLLSSTTDPNGQTTTYNYYDAYGRVGEIDYPSDGGGKTIFSYSLTQASIHQYHDGSTYSDTEIQYDGYGRKSRVAIANGQGTNPYYQNDICYDQDGRVSFESYRYQGTGFNMSKVCSGNGDTYSYDALSTNVAHGDGTSISYHYQSRAVQITDENGVSRILQKNVFGQLTGVCEISSNGSMPGGSGSPAECGLDIAGTGFLTSYAPDFTNLRTTVTQGQQTQRVFETDALGRPVFVQEPESGQTSYSYVYDSTGLQVTRTRPEANQTNSGVTTTTITQYDTLGRPVSVTYSDGTPTKTFSYDATAGWNNPPQNYLKGRLSYASVSGATTIFDYDAMGRINALGQCTPSTCGSRSFTTWHTHDWVGNLTSSGDGFGATNSYTYSQDNEVTSITSSLNDSNHPPDIVSSVKNGPFGPLSWQLGNGLSGVRQYDSMGRVTGGWVCQGSTESYCSGGSQVYGFTDSWKGPYMTSACDTVLDACSDYQYDEFGRLSALNTQAGYAWPSYTYVYDRWGNRWDETLKSGSGPAPTFSFNTSNNQIQQSGSCNPVTSTQTCYDAAGNLIADGEHTYSYDAEGNLTLVDGGSTATYTYDALNQRVRTANAGQDTYEYIFNPSGQRASILDATYGWQLQGQSYWGSTPVEFYDNGIAQYQHQDWIGTERADTTNTGSTEGTYTSLPFGDAYTVSGQDNDAYHFAGMDYDSGSNTYHADFRQYYDVAGRWMSPDPSSGSYDFTNPQSFNRYSYVSNSPLSLTDPQGLGEGGCGWICDIPPIDLLCLIFCHGGGGGGPGIGTFHGSLKPRTNAQPWDEYHIHYGADMADALGLPDAGCEFGACGGIPGENFGPAVAVGGTVVCQIVEPCGAIEDGILVGAVILTGAAAIWEMSKGGTQNVAHQYVRNMANGMPGDYCSNLKAIMDQARRSGNSKLFNDAKATWKQDCRGR